MDREVKRRPLTLAQKHEHALTLAKIEEQTYRKFNAALGRNRVRRVIEAAKLEGKFISHNQSGGRGAHYRYQDGSAIGAEVLR